MKRTLLLLAAVALCANVAGAADVGAPVFPKDLKGLNEWELSYQYLNRDLDSGVTLEADTYVVRFHTELSPSALLDLDAGVLDADGMGFYGGVGLRYLAYENASFHVSPFGMLHYGAGADADEVGGDFDLFQGDFGVTFAGHVALAEGLELQPYAGPLFSIVRVSPDEGEDADEENVVGALLGLALVMPDRNSIRVEAQLFDEVSFSVGFSLVFQ